MPTQVLSNYASNRLLAYLLDGWHYLACHTVDPGVTGREVTEVLGGGYQRQPIRFSTPSSRSCANDVPVIFSGMPASTVRYIAVWNLISGGEMLLAAPLPQPIQMPHSSQFRLEIGDFAISI